VITRIGLVGVDAASAAVPVGGRRSVRQCRERGEYARGMAHPRLTAAMTTLSSLGPPTARRYRNRLACALPHERCRPGARSLRGPLLASSKGRMAGARTGTRDRGRRSPGSHPGPGRARDWPAMGEYPLPPPEIGGKRTVGRPREMGHGSAHSRGKAVRFIGPYCLRPERHLCHAGTRALTRTMGRAFGHWGSSGGARRAVVRGP
jgi:hypothetical protein